MYGKYELSYIGMACWQTWDLLDPRVVVFLTGDLEIRYRMKTAEL